MNREECTFLNRGLIVDIIDIDNPRVIFQTDSSTTPLNVSIYDVDPTLLHLYIKEKYDGCMNHIKWY
jgi:predicted AlkP superfamily phosphohydrolase/phosphomutase